MCVYIWVCFCTENTVSACNFASFSGNICSNLYLYLSVSLYASFSKSICRPSELTLCTFIPGARIDNWIRGSIISTQWPSLIRERSQNGRLRGETVPHRNHCGLLNKRAIKHSPLALAKESLC